MAKTNTEPEKTDEQEREELLNKLAYDERVKRYRVSIARKVVDGQTGLRSELEYLRELEEKQGKDGLQTKPAGEEVGIPERLKIKRKYTKGPDYMSDAAVEARRKGGKARARKGTKPNWKHGKYSKSFVTGSIRPCKSTCTQYPCEIIKEGSTTPGDACLDKVAVIQSYRAIIKAIDNKDYGDFHDLAALTISKSIEVLNMSLEDIIRDGTMVKSEKLDKDGCVIGHDVKPHPSLLVLPKLLADLGMTPQEVMITPRQIAKQGSEEDGIKTIADLMSQVGNKIKKQAEGKGEPDED